ncbi:hypothetical protein C2869_10415 [Saccharobesus litoralis]|uniref:Nitrite reductase n=1 Tax=Saccharobesus litoralis TaxID=2172099 RepID=A0A2S0VRH5_9ALTE|nr:FAD-dependent oxidoreductase [Saccharobesus litoralis]AWB66817.1 hypothetical protein C2869_10415 [Saccharobesus litoralis]
MSHPIIVVGTGPVGIRFIKELRKLDAETPILLFGNEPWQPYNRVKLSSLLANEMSWDDITSKDWAAIQTDSNTTTHLNCPINSIDKEKRIVVDADGVEHHYSQLVMAIGSRPYIPNIPNVEMTGVYTFRDLNDVQALIARNVRSRHICVLGGGLLGLETAKALCRHNTQVTVIQRSSHLMNNQLDETAAALLQKTVEAEGVNVICGQGVTEVLRDDKGLTGIKFRNGEVFSCDTVVLATGIIPNRGLALEAGLAVGKGIKVNNSLQTSDDSIYAIGECAEHAGMTYGLVAPGFEQAAIAARHIYENDDKSSYLGSTTAAELKVVGEQVFSIGELYGPRAPFVKEWVYNKDGVYRKIITRRGKIIGAQAVGDWNESKRIQEMLTTKKRLWFWQLLRFQFSGNLFPENENAIQNWPDDTFICQCMAVQKGRLMSCVQSGCKTVKDLGAQTGAGTVCGSCQPLLVQLLGAKAKREPDPKWKVLLQTCTATLVLSLVFLLLPAIAYSTSVQGMNLDKLWVDGLYKQISGFSLLALSVFITLLSFRKRIKKFKWLSYPIWRVIHTALGIVLLMVLVTHTGLQMGSNLNFALMISYIAVSLVGVFAGVSVALEHKLSDSSAKLFRKMSYWGHVLASWPLPTLLTFHIVSVYYF